MFLSFYSVVLSLPPIAAQNAVTSVEGPRISVVPVSSTAISPLEPGISEGESSRGFEFTVIPRRGSFQKIRCSLPRSNHRYVLESVGIVSYIRIQLSDCERDMVAAEEFKSALLLSFGQGCRQRSGRNHSSLQKMFSRIVLPDAPGMNPERGKERPKIPEFPVLDRFKPLVSLTRPVDIIMHA